MLRDSTEAQAKCGGSTNIAQLHLNVVSMFVHFTFHFTFHVCPSFSSSVPSLASLGF